MLKHPLDFNTRKTLCVQLGEPAGRAIADLIFQLAMRVDALERGKVDVTPVVPAESRMPRTFFSPCEEDR
ncbi:MAG: hypothetical protein FJ297_17180 [Planctomycetes bacterium]|nr:hypothetical protein [Planctomycetota bacterium]